MSKSKVLISWVGCVLEINDKTFSAQLKIQEFQIKMKENKIVHVLPIEDQLQVVGENFVMAMIAYDESMNHLATNARKPVKSLIHAIQAAKTFAIPDRYPHVLFMVETELTPSTYFGRIHNGELIFLDVGCYQIDDFVFFDDQLGCSTCLDEKIFHKEYDSIQQYYSIDRSKNKINMKNQNFYTLSLRNYGKFENVTLSLNSQLSVLIGSSNSGKTTVLNSILNLFVPASASKESIRESESSFFISLENASKFVKSVEVFKSGEIKHKGISKDFVAVLNGIHLPYFENRYNSDQVIQAIKKFIPDCIGFYFVDTEFNSKELMLKFDTDKRVLASRLGSGYQRILSIILAAACVSFAIGDCQVQHKFLLINDDVEIYLHPNIQKIILPILKKIFPDVCFVCTTHSPFIVQSLKANEVVNLDSESLCEDPENLSLDDVSLFMGVQDSKSDKFFRKGKIAEEYLKLLSDADESASEKLDELLMEFGDDSVFIAKLKMERLFKEDCKN